MASYPRPAWFNYQRSPPFQAAQETLSERAIKRDWLSDSCSSGQIFSTTQIGSPPDTYPGGSNSDNRKRYLLDMKSPDLRKQKLGSTPGNQFHHLQQPSLTCSIVLVVHDIGRNYFRQNQQFACGRENR